METIALKNSIHKIIDSIENEYLLQSLLDFLNESKSSNAYWNHLSEEQKNEVLLSFEESEEEYNLIERTEVIKK
jgi:hypothetical protein